MINILQINPSKCFVIPFGITENKLPPDKDLCKKKVALLHSIKEDEKILLFNGALDYMPNINALKVILDEINPLLLQSCLKYKIIVCGRKLPAYFNALENYSDKNIIYAGFVDDVEVYFKAADIFMNPVQTGGGVKTKLIEAIGYNIMVISTVSGAIGVNKSVCENKLAVVGDNDWETFAATIIKRLDEKTNTSKAFYQMYYLGNIVKLVIKTISFF